MNVPTYLKQVTVRIPTMLDFDVFHIVKSPTYQILEHKLTGTNREASTAFAASVN